MVLKKRLELSSDGTLIMAQVRLSHCLTIMTFGTAPKIYAELCLTYQSVIVDLGGMISK